MGLGAAYDSPRHRAISRSGRPVALVADADNMIISIGLKGHPLAAGCDSTFHVPHATNMIVVEPKGHPLQQLPDLTDRLKALGAHDEYVKYRNDYLKWRKG
eukprot:CAMPEP_0203958804 /NCGR_PEP_ID=MMETSP0359-20131031/90113_1 /ASSEMBLY_ACC=CAM_ASM_000338 /TAXON_ID=268821 /ORGANISM="Scrippsiella Hangoei, Strain SHTV-5" /LENGTH=100 /DNA_ID=CAMNT_0050892801 /DNA_START=28 /DNA_END=327 /DNA_ORIENTATION=+